MFRNVARVAASLLVFSLAPAFAFAQQPTKTALHGGIEVGSKGVRGVVLEIQHVNGIQQITRRFAKSVNTTVIHGSHDSKTLRPDSIAETVQQVVRFHQIMIEEQKLQARSIEIVISSGVALASNKQELADAIRAKLGLPVTFMTYEEELKRVFFGVVPSDQINHAMLYDQGSGNSKTIAFGDRGPGNWGWYVRQHLPLGTVSLTQKIDAEAEKSGRSFADQIAQARGILDADWAGLADGTPTLRLHRPTAYLTGGAVWALATILHPERTHQSMVKLSYKDFDRFVELLQRQPNDFPKVDVSHLDERTQKAAAEELQRVRDTFSVKNLLAGAELLRSAAKANRFDTKQLYFARDGVFAWIVGGVNQAHHDADVTLGHATDAARVRRTRR